MNVSHLASSLVSLFLLSTLSCSSVSPDSPVSVPRLSSPIFQSVSVAGLAFRDERVAGRSVSVGTANTQLQAHGQTNSNITGLATTPQGSAIVSGRGSTATNLYGSTSTTTAAHAIHYESFDSDDLILELRRTIEDAGIAEEVQFGGSGFRIEGHVIESGPSTGAGRICWNVFNCVTLLFLLGGPILGSCDAEIELRLYSGDRFLRSYRGNGRATWRTQYAPIPIARMDARRLASKLAVRDAVSKLIADPPPNRP